MNILKCGYHPIRRWRRDFMGTGDFEWGYTAPEGIEPIPGPLVAWEVEDAEQQYLERYNILTGRTH